MQHLYLCVLTYKRCIYHFYYNTEVRGYSKITIEGSVGTNTISSDGKTMGGLGINMVRIICNMVIWYWFNSSCVRPTKREGNYGIDLRVGNFSWALPYAQVNGNRARKSSDT